MFILDTISSNNMLLQGLCSITVCLIIGFGLKSYITSRIVETTDSQSPQFPQTFNFTIEQLAEIEAALDRGEVLDEELQAELDQDFEQVLGENYAQYQAEVAQIQTNLQAELFDILNNMDLFN